MSDLVVFQKQLDPLAPMLERALSGSNIKIEHFIQSVLISTERLPMLLDPNKVNRQTLFNAAMTAAVVGLPVDGALGQGYIVPFKGKAQFLTGYKGLSTLAARGSYAVRGDVVREGDDFEIDKPRGVIHHRAQPNNSGRIVAAWALAASNHLPTHAEVVWLDELLAIRKRASDSSPAWNDSIIGFPAMCAKTAKRRLSRSVPYGDLPQFTMAARIDEAVEEQGVHAWASPERGVVIEGELLPERETSSALTAEELAAGRLSERVAKFEAALKSASLDKAQRLWNLNEPLRNELKADDRHDKTLLRLEAIMSEKS